MGPGLSLLLMSMRQSLIIWRILYGIAKKRTFAYLKLHTHIFLCFTAVLYFVLLHVLGHTKLLGTCLIEMYEVYIIRIGQN